MKLSSLFVGAAIAGAATGCYGSERPPTAAEQKAGYPLAGLHVPDSEIGLTAERRNAIAAQGSAGGSALKDNQADLQQTLVDASKVSNKCVGAVGTSGTAGKLEISFTTASYMGRYHPENCGAIWIEDAAGNYIATPAIWARIRTRPLFFYQAVRCQQDKPDAVTSATLETHKSHSVTWDGKDLLDRVVPDGMYVLNIEVTEDEADAGQRTKYPFMKGAAPETLMPADTTSVKGLKLVYTPEPATPTDPSTGAI
jgi:hypothetical protein